MTGLEALGLTMLVVMIGAIFMKFGRAPAIRSMSFTLVSSKLLTNANRIPL